MAKKDSIKALVTKGVSEETATKLFERYASKASIERAGVQEISEYLGISEDEASDLLSMISKKTIGTRKEPELSIPVEPMELQYKDHMSNLNDEEKLLMEACDKEKIVVGKDLPLKVIMDLAQKLVPKSKKTDSLDESKRRELVREASVMYKKREMDYNESAGVMAAQSIGEPGTQMNMRTFHNAGVANLVLTQGLPRLIEIVDARRVPSTPSMVIPLDDAINKDESVSKRVANAIVYLIQTTTLINIADIEADLSNMKLIVTPDPDKMMTHRIGFDESDDLAGLEIGMDKGTEYQLEVVKSKLEETKALRGNVEIDGMKLIISLQKPNYNKLLQLFDVAKNVKIKGITGIKRAVLTKDNGKWVIITEGSNLKEVMKIRGIDISKINGKSGESQFVGPDRSKISTNSIMEIADVFGIEAARNAIIKEASVTLGAAGLNVDQRHIMLVADLMTNDGTVKAIGRHGISGKKSSVLARAAFEITAPHLLQAAINGEVDSLQGVTENIITGQPVTLGTGAINLVYEPKKKGDKK